MVRGMPSFCRTQRLCVRSLSTCWVSKHHPFGVGWAVRRQPEVQAGNLLTVPLTCLPLRLILMPTDVSQLIDTICGVGNMSANASAQERTPWHVTIKVPGRRDGAWIPELKEAMGQKHRSP